jgi:ribosomal protein S2
MSTNQNPEPSQTQLHEVQAALFNLRDGLMNLKMSLQELAFMTDEDAQRQAMSEAQNLFHRLRG